MVNQLFLWAIFNCYVTNYQRLFQSISEVLIHPQMRRFSMPHKYHDTLWCFLRDRSKERALSSHFGSDHSVTHIEISHQYMFIHVFFTIEMHFLFHDQPTKMISLLNLIKHGKQTQWEQVMVKKKCPSGWPQTDHRNLRLPWCLWPFGPGCYQLHLRVPPSPTGTSDILGENPPKVHWLVIVFPIRMAIWESFHHIFRRTQSDAPSKTQT